MSDGLSTLYQDLLNGSYDCVDRIVLNAYFRMGHSPGGFRVWWRALTGSDETLENAYLMRMAGRFSRRVRGYAKAHNIPVIDCSMGERKHDIAEALGLTRFGGHPESLGHCQVGSFGRAVAGCEHDDIAEPVSRLPLPARCHRACGLALSLLQPELARC